MSLCHSINDYFIGLEMLLNITACTFNSSILVNTAVYNFMFVPMQCSVTCGSGEQTRQVMCVASAGGNHVADYMCSSLPKPPSIQTCEMPVCITRIGWHIGDWGLVRCAILWHLDF